MKKENVFNFISSFVLSTLLLFGGQAQAQTLPDTGGRLYGARITVDNNLRSNILGIVDMRTRSFNFDNAEYAYDFFFNHSSGISFEDREFSSEGGSFLASGFSGYSSGNSAGSYEYTPNNIPNSRLEVAANIQGALLILTYAGDQAALDSNGNPITQSGSPVIRVDNILNFRVPDLGIDIFCSPGGCALTRDEALTLESQFAASNPPFVFATRDDSEDALADYLKDTDFLSKLQTHLAAASSTSIVAGNPSSLQSTLAASAFNNAVGLEPDSDVSADVNDNIDGSVSGGNGEVTANNVIPVGLQYGRYRQAGMDVDNHTLPIRYAYEWSDGKKISVGLPLSYVTINDAEVYKVGVELAYTHPMNKQWKLTPGFGYGMIGSKDLLTGAQVASFSLTSLYKFDQSMVGGEDWSLSIANMVGYYKTFALPFKINDIKVGAELSNQIIKNGLILDAKKDIFNYPVNIKAYFADTRFFGDALYSERYDEIGVFISPNKKRSFGQNQGLNMSYLFAEGDISGFNLSYSYRF